MFDTIVFSQPELEEAIKSDCKSICLCDNKFLLPFSYDMKYFAIGDVYANIQMTSAQAIQNNVTFEGFLPVFSQGTKQKPKSVSSRSGSYMYEYEYEYEYRSSYRASSGSVSSYHTSFVCSYRGNKTVFVNGYGVNLI